MNNGSLFDSKIFHFIERVVDALIINVFWIICCLPIFTIGAATSAMYYTVHKVVFQQRGYTREFWKAFKDNFKNSTIVWIPDALIILFLMSDLYITDGMNQRGEALGVLMIVCAIVLCIVVTLSMFLFAYMARFTDSVKRSIKNILFIAPVNFGATFGSFIILGIMILATYLIPPAIIVTPVLAVIALHPVYEGVFKQYLSEEDLRKEEELDRDFTKD